MDSCKQLLCYVITASMMLEAKDTDTASPEKLRLNSYGFNIIMAW